MQNDLQPNKDDDDEHPIAPAWRSAFKEIVKAFVRGDFCLSVPIQGVDPIPPEDAKQIEAYISDYGETLVELPDETWQTSFAQWRGRHWDFMVDLWTKESGCSDMVLAGQVFEDGDGYRIVVDLVYVP
jgi:hypothetical protein